MQTTSLNLIKTMTIAFLLKDYIFFLQIALNDIIKEQQKNIQIQVKLRIIAFIYI